MTNRIRFTKEKLEGLPLPPQGKRTTHYDTTVPKLAVRQHRSLIRYRHALVDRRTGVKNTIRSLLDAQISVLVEAYRLDASRPRPRRTELVVDRLEAVGAMEGGTPRPGVGRTWTVDVLCRYLGLVYVLRRRSRSSCTPASYNLQTFGCVIRRAKRTSSNSRSGPLERWLIVVFNATGARRMTSYAS